MFTDAEIEQANQRVPLDELIGRDVALKRKGREWAGVCPFHNEKTPSFYVNVEKGFFHCFGCGAHGNAVNFVMRQHHLDFPQAMRYLLDLPEAALRKREAPRQVKRAPKESDIATARKLLMPPAMPVTTQTAAGLYLYSRGLSPMQPGLRAHPELLWSEEVDGDGPEQPPWRRWYSQRRETWVRGAEFPALLAPIKNSAGHVTAVQQIWCVGYFQYGDAATKDARAPVDIRKKTRGDMQDGCVRLAAAAEYMGIAEGVETAIAASMLYKVPVWATCGAARMATVLLPPLVRHLMIFGDNGQTGVELASQAADKHAALKRYTLEMIFPRSGYDDFNTQLLAKQGRAA